MPSNNFYTSLIILNMLFHIPIYGAHKPVKISFTGDIIIHKSMYSKNKNSSLINLRFNPDFTSH